MSQSKSYREWYDIHHPKGYWPVNQSGDGTNFHSCNFYGHNLIITCSLKCQHIFRSEKSLGTMVIFLLCNNLFIYQVLCTLIYRRRSLYSFLWDVATTLQWRHYEPEGVSNHHRLDCLLNRLITQLKGNIKAPHHWPLWGESSDPLTKASSAENVSIW